MIKEYEKIEGLFARDEGTKKLKEGEFINPTIEFLKNISWDFTEKIDGTNIRIYWDGHKVSCYGRTDKAAIPSQLMNKLIELFGGDVNEEMFEQKFGSNPVILIGEGYGNKIQACGKDYRDDNSFILFDVWIRGKYLSRENVNNIAKYFGIEAVPVLFKGTLEDGIEFVKSKPYSTIGVAKMEGLVARPSMELLDENGNRLIVKIKVRDFEEVKND